MDQTTKLKLPYILAAQSQKHVTHNEALRVLDALVQLAVVDKDLSAPPGAPAEGHCYIVGASPTGAWAGHAGHVAAFQDGAWAFHPPLEGWVAWVSDEDTLYAFNGTNWVVGGSGVNPASLVGVNATADSTNRLSVVSPASLFNHAGAGHQLKINKAAAGDTGSVLFQTGFSGRAEFGLAGDDDFHVKVSADGSAWHEAIVINRSNGTVKGVGIREKLIANRTYYVRTDGSDSNTGLANTSGGAFLTIQKAINTVAALDLSTFNVEIVVGAGTYGAGFGMNGMWVGSGTVQLTGDVTTPSNVTVQATSANLFQVTSRAKIFIRGFKLVTTSSGSLVRCQSGHIVLNGNMEYGQAGFYQLEARDGGFIEVTANYSISGSPGIAHWGLNTNGMLYCVARTITLTGTPNWPTAFVEATLGAVAEVHANTFSGSATGKRYDITRTAAARASASATYFPGDVAGTTATGGQYGA
jgi:hypothetical protein